MSNELEMLPADFDVEAHQLEPIFEWDGDHSVWRVYMPNGAVYLGRTFKDVCERMGVKWN